MDDNKNFTPFDGTNYNIWKLRVRALIDELIIDRNALSIIDSESKPDDVDELEWLKRNKLAKGIIIRNLKNNMVRFATDSPDLSARDIFIKLDSLFSRTSVATELAMQLKLANFKYEENSTLTKHIVMFDELISDFETASGDKLKETFKIARLLSSLPKTFAPLVIAIQTLSDDKITLPFVKVRLLEHEVQLNSEIKDTSSKVLPVIKDNRGNNNNNQYNRRFDNKVKFNNRNLNFKKFVKCHHCGRKGHLIKNCYLLKQNKYNKKDNNKSMNIVHSAQVDNSKGFAFMAGNNVKIDEISFIIDSGASDHIINNDELFEHFVELNPPIKIAVAKNNVYINATKRGFILLQTTDNVEIVMENVLYSQDATHNLLSVKKFQDAGMSVLFNPTGIEVLKDGALVTKGNISNNISLINLKCKKYVSQLNVALNCDYLLWHRRLGHISKDKFLELKSKNMIKDVNLIENIKPNNELCEACIYGKQACLKYNSAKDKKHVNRPLFIVHTDVCGPITPVALENKNYFVTYIDEYTHYCVTYLLTYKSEVFSTFKDFVAKAEAHFNSKIVHLYSDNGREYLSNDMKAFCVAKGITFHLTVPHSPQLNGVAERYMRTITEKARSLVHGAKLDKMFWGEAVLTATFLINISPCKALKTLKTPYEMWHSKKPEIKNLKVFGATMYIHNKTKPTKFDKKSWKGIHVGYVPNGYKVWDVENEKFVTARDVIVDEISYLISRPGIKSNNFESESMAESDHENDVSRLNIKRVRNSDLPESMARNEKVNDTNIMSESMTENDTNIMSESMTENDTNTMSESMTEKDSSTNIMSESMTESQDKNDLPERMASVPQNVKHNELRRSSRLLEKNRISYNEDDCIDHCFMTAQTVLNNIPRFFHEVKTRSDCALWEQAIESELQSHFLNKTWTVVDKPLDKNVIDSRWVFNIKHDAFGNISKYKARLVARGFTQEYLTDYFETFAPVARISSFRFILAFSNEFNLLVHHMDVQTAFLNGVLSEEIYMKVPEGLKCDNNKVCKLNKAVYGLKQAARCWFKMFDIALKEKLFKNSLVDRCLYMLDCGDLKHNIYVILYVDDLVIATASIERMRDFKNYLSSKFKMTDMGEIKHFVGIKIDRSEDEITLSQSVYINSVINKFNMRDCNSVSTPLQTKINYTELNTGEIYDAPCKNLIGCLMYIMLCTRPDLSASISILSRYSSRSTKELWQSLKRILRYLKGSVNLKLTYKKCNFENILKGYVDSDWGGGDENDRKSTTGFLFKLFDQNTITWNTRKQTSVAASSTEAEYMALFEGVKEALWLKSLAESVNIKIERPIIIFEDNNGCISIANNPACHKRSKHIIIKYHFSREQIERNVIKLNYICTEDQIADILTKSLPTVSFIKHRDAIGLKIKC